MTLGSKVADLTIRPGEMDDTEAILELVRSSLGEGVVPRSREFWEWKHQSSPFGPSSVLLAEAKDQLVGLRAFMRWEWCSAGRAFSAVRAVDTATHRDWQGKGIFKRLTLQMVEHMQEEGISFVYNTPNEQSGPGYLKMGWSSLGKTSLWIRPNRPLRMLRRLRGGASESRESDNGSQAGFDAGFASAADLMEQHELALFLQRLSTSDPRIRTRLTPAYLMWRYVNVPGFDYYAVWAFDGDEGAVVLFRFKARSGLTELRICELALAPTKRSIGLGRELVRDLVSRCGADFVAVMAARRTPEERVLWGIGFIPAPHAGPILTVRPLNPLAPGVEPLERNSWRPTIGALELF